MFQKYHTCDHRAMLRALVDYGDDSEEEYTNIEEPVKANSRDLCSTKRKDGLPHRQSSPPKKIRALPALDPSLFTPAPVDDPSKHQGRKRTIPGLPRVTETHRWVCAVGYSCLALTFRTCTRDYCLSRPVPLRAHQRDGFRKEVRKAALECPQFLASFAQLTTLTNEDQSRTFLCVEIGAGHNGFRALSQSFVPSESDKTPSANLPRNGDGIQEPKSESSISPSTNVASLVENLQSKFSKQLLELGSDFKNATAAQYVLELKAFLTTPLVESLISAHPNEIAIKGELASFNECDDHWWEWVGQVDPEARQAMIESLIRTATDQAVQDDVELHPSLRQLINRIAQLRLPRAPEGILDISGFHDHRNTGMSPKKAHEVHQLSNLIDKIYNTSINDSNRLIVDVGAGQGYLSHRLAEHSGTHVLALDGDEGQTEGATLRGKGLSHAERQRARNRGGSPTHDGEANHQAPPVTHQTLFITSDSLLHAVDEWIGDLDFVRGTLPPPVLITGLHACGSLTPAVLRCFTDLCTRVGQEGHAKRKWSPVALALVGCCYNLMRNADDFPLSETTTRAHPRVSLHLTQNHLQLAAQCPAQWSRSENEIQRASLARRKIVWRAMLAKSIHHSSHTTSLPSKKPPNRLGRLSDRVYANWESFVRTACEKMGLPSIITEELLAGSPDGW
ncbi:hypothetical protein OPQ81_011514 [Rhizoctonia solani]|nr:hypothetical protein OPQ81_011514 [Rhizoctonia solani]